MIEGTLEARQGKADVRIGTRLSSYHGAQMREDWSW